MAAAEDTVGLGESFVAATGLTGAEAKCAIKALRLFPVPSMGLAPCLFSSLGRVIAGVPWAGELFPEATDYADLERLAATGRLHQADDPTRFPSPSQTQLAELFRGPFRLAAAVLGLEPENEHDPVLERLRCVLVACRVRWGRGDTSRDQAIEDLATFIRGQVALIKDARSAFSIDLVTRLVRATTLEAFADAAAGLAHLGHETLASAWVAHFDPELRGRARVPKSGRRSAAQPASTPTPAPLVQGPTTQPAKRRSARRNVRRNTDDVRRTVRRKLVMSEGVKPLEGEPASEVSAPGFVGALPGGQHNRESKEVARYRVQQAIRGRNHDLLVEHPDVLPLVSYSRAITGLLEVLDGEGDEDLRYGACALLLEGIFGRTARTLTAIDVLAEESEPVDSTRLQIVMERQAARLVVYWQADEGDDPSGHFRPTAEQAKLLEPVRADFLLPLAPAIFTRLEKNRASIERLAREDVAATVLHVGTAARHVRKTYGVEFTPGQIRGSASVFLRDTCNDTAAAQLICADTIGVSDCPVSYFAPLASSLADTFWSFQHRILDLAEVPPTPVTQAGRVGSRLVTLPSVAKALVKSVSAPLRRGVARLSSEGRLREVHQVMVNQLSCMFVAGLTHRPTEALLELRLSDIWLDGSVGAALFYDKRIDAAHDPRLVALSSIVCRQLNAYLSHLAALGEGSDALGRHINNVLLGEAPLFFALTDACEPIPLTFAMWKAGLPEPWSALPLNWGRHSCRTRAIEAGVPADLVNIQMGHLESAGYPFSGASPTEPLLFAEQLAPLWDRVVSEQGWTVVAGLKASAGCHQQILMPLSRWAPRVEEHARKRRDAARNWEQRMEATTRVYREAAEASVLAHPVLVESGIASLYLEGLRAGPAPPHGLTRADFSDVRDDLVADVVDPVAAIALGDALRRVVRRVNRRTGQDAETPGSLVFFRAPLDSAFLPGMMTAVRQFGALREYVGAYQAAGKKRDDWRDAPSAFARVVLAIILFGHGDDPEAIRGAIERRLSLCRSAALEDVVLVPHGEKPGEVMALRGASAIAFAHLARKLPNVAWPGWRAIEDAMRALLPAWAIPRQALADGELVTRLCQTAAVVARYELSPAARAARGPGGCTSAELDLQLAWLDGDPPGAFEWQPQASECVHESRGAKLPPCTGAARSQYLTLCRVFPTTDRDTRLPQTGYVIPSGDAASADARRAVIQEITAMRSVVAAERRLRPIVDHLAGWVLDMLEHGTPRKREAALSTIETYLSRIGGLLVELFGQGATGAVDETELEDIYLTTIEARVNQRAVAASALLLFHRYAQGVHDYPDADLTGVRAYLSTRELEEADAGLITPVERDVVTDLLLEGHTVISDAPPDNPDQRRLRMQAGHAASLLAFTGARRGEGLGIQFRDVQRLGMQLRLRIRGNRSRRLKTPNARRYVYLPLGKRADSFDRFVRGEQQRIGSTRLRTAFVFAPPDDPRAAQVRSQIASILLGACREVTGRPRTRVHALRHLVAAERTLPSFLAPGDYTSIALTATLAPAPAAGVVLPRDLAGRVTGLGHGNARTTIRWYHHMPWLLASRTDAWMSERYVRRRVIASLLGVTPFAMDRHTQGQPDVPCSRVWLDAQCAPRPRPARPAPSSPVAESSSTSDHWTACHLGLAVLEARRMGSLEQAVEHRGGTVADARTLESLVHLVERRLGWPITTQGSGRASARDVLAFRRLAEGQVFEQFWQWYDDDPEWRTQLGSVAAAFFNAATCSDRDAVVLPTAQAEVLKRALTKLGLDQHRLQESTLAPGLISIRVLRRIPEASGTHKAEDSPESPHETPYVGKPTNALTRRYLGRPLKWALSIIFIVEQWQHAGAARDQA